MPKEDLVAFDDLSKEEIESIFTRADEMAASVKDKWFDPAHHKTGLCAGRIMATLFYEPSTRTRLSFESAMLRLGGGVISSADMRNSSVAKGETIADTARTVSAYADLIVIRHPWEGAARVAADYASVPVINAGDGGHEHPTQTLCDLYTLKKEKGQIRNSNVLLWGDLKYGRTVHSLVYGLARFGARIFLCPMAGLELPQHVISRVKSERNCQLFTLKAQDLQQLGVGVDMLYLAPLHQLPLFATSVQGLLAEKLPRIDALYVTRVQKERFMQTVDGEPGYPSIDLKFLRKPEFHNALVMHPLPRVDELDYSVDDHPTSVYFKQAAYGVPVRMALIEMLLGAKGAWRPPGAPPKPFVSYKEAVGIQCPNANCVSRQERHGVAPGLRRVNDRPLTLRCRYCEHEIAPPYIASSRWHEGTLDNKKYYPAGSYMLERIKPENLIIFGSEAVAQARGFKPGKGPMKESNDVENAA